MLVTNVDWDDQEPELEDVAGRGTSSMSSNSVVVKIASHEGIGMALLKQFCHEECGESVNSGVGLGEVAKVSLNDLIVEPCVGPKSLKIPQ